MSQWRLSFSFQKRCAFDNELLLMKGATLKDGLLWTVRMAFLSGKAVVMIRVFLFSRLFLLTCVVVLLSWDASPLVVFLGCNKE
eukprot:3639570-Amphidinium_carterae.2